MSKFSVRHDFAREGRSITIREGAPDRLRDAVAVISYESGLSPHQLRSVVCRVLRRREDPNNWSAYPNVDGEAREHLESCPWYKVYDIVEALATEVEDLDGFESEINEILVEEGIGWKLMQGRVEARGEEAFELSVQAARSSLENAQRLTASQEIHEALKDLSRRPEPDITGGIQHALAALECVARDVAHNERGTLGAVIKHNPGLFPAPLDTAIEKLWGFASEQGRHLREGRSPGYDEATLCLHVSAALALYLSNKAGSR